MSHIFDALQQSAVSRPILSFLPRRLRPTLLEATERKTAAARAKAIVIEAVDWRARPSY